MNELAEKQIHDDYREILSSEAGMRVLGGILLLGRINGYEQMNDYQQGRRSIAVQIANTIYKVNPYGIADCMTAYEDFMKENADDERRDDTDPYEYSE